MQKVVIIGLDGATWKLIDPWLDQMPFFSWLIKNGMRANLQSTVPPMTAPAWASFQTGLHPGHHGIWGFKTKEGKLVNSKLITAPRIWHMLDLFQKKYCFLNLPMTWPLPEANGIIVSSLLTPPGKPYCNQPKIYKLLKKMNYQVDVKLERYGLFADEAIIAKNKEKIYKQALFVAKKRFEAVEKLCELEDWDLFFCLFRETDTLQHLFWDGPETLALYKKIDIYLQKIYQKFSHKFGANFSFFVISDHGFHPAPKWRFFISHWLKEQGFLEEIKLRKQLPYYLKLARFGWRLAGKAIKKIPGVQKLKAKRDKFVAAVEKKTVKTLAIQPVQNGLFSAKGSDLQRRFQNLTYKKCRVFQFVKRKEEIYPGSQNNPSVPDIIFLEKPDYIIDPDLFASKTIVKNSTPQLGLHNADPIGIFLASGSGIKKNQRLKKPAFIWDLPTTILYLLDLPFFPKMDGRSLKNIFRPSSAVLKQKVKWLSEEKKVELLMKSQIKHLGGE